MVNSCNIHIHKAIKIKRNHAKDIILRKKNANRIWEWQTSESLSIMALFCVTIEYKYIVVHIYLFRIQQRREESNMLKPAFVLFLKLSSFLFRKSSLFDLLCLENWSKIRTLRLLGNEKGIMSCVFNGAW